MWVTSVGDVCGRRVWATSIGDEHGRRAWTMSVRGMRGGNGRVNRGTSMSARPVKCSHIQGADDETREAQGGDLAQDSIDHG